MSLAFAMSLAAAQDTAASGAGATRSPAIRLRVVNEGALDRRSLMVAQKDLTEIVTRAGVSVIWLNCASGWADWLSAGPCQQEREPYEFWLRLVMRKPAETSENVLGFTELDENLGIRSAGVYYPAAVEAAGKYGLASGEVVGAAMAHEIGHLVLGADAHSREGLMSPDWTRSQFKRLSIGELSFTSSEATLLRDELRRPRPQPCGSKPTLRSAGAMFFPE
jgi:hypothetical protein